MSERASIVEDVCWHLNEALSMLHELHVENHSDGGGNRPGLGECEPCDIWTKGRAALAVAIAEFGPDQDNAMSDGEPCPTCGFPVELANLLRNQSIVVCQDAAVWEMIARWHQAPSNTASAALTPEQETP